MSSFKEKMSKLRMSQEKTEQVKVGGNKEQNKYLFPQPNKTYIVRLLPYLTEANNPQTIKEVWFHKIGNQKYLCEGGKYAGCPHCEQNIKPLSQKYLNLQVIKTNDTKVKEGSYYILPIHYKLYEILDEYEKRNGCSLFDIFEAGEVTINVTEEINGTYKNVSFTTSKISDIKTSISPEINSYDEDQIISFIKEFTYDLDKEIIVPKFKEVESDSDVKVVEEKPILKTTFNAPEKPSVKEIQSSISDMKNLIDDEDLEVSFEEPKVLETPKQVKETTKKTTKKDESTTSDDTSSSFKNDVDTEDYIKDFLSSIND